MKGLILKDFYNILAYSKTVFVMIILFLVMGISQTNYFMVSMIAVFATTMVISCFSYDNLVKWDLYSNCLPLSRNKIVASRYLLSLILCGIASAAAMLIMAVSAYLQNEFQLKNILLIGWAIFFFVIFFLDLGLPFIYKMGVEKARIVIIALLFIPTALFVLISKSGGTNLDQIIQGLYNPLYLLFTPVILLAVTLVSYLISAKIYRGKDM